MSEIEAHYQRVSQAWHMVMGERQHFGLYRDGRESINQASAQLVDLLFDKIHVDAQHHVLEVGCGTGGSARYLQQTFGCAVSGIALCEREITQATALAPPHTPLQFVKADGQANPFADCSFDMVIMLESSLLVPNKLLLFQENFRVLKSGGYLLLCDQIKPAALKLSDMYRLGSQIECLRECFGNTQTESLAAYQHYLEQAGFSDIETEDIGKQLLLSPSRWKHSAQHQKADLEKLFNEKQFNNFLQACDILESFMEKNILSYGLVRAKKP